LPVVRHNDVTHAHNEMQNLSVNVYVAPAVRELPWKR